MDSVVDQGCSPQQEKLVPSPEGLLHRKKKNIWDLISGGASQYQGTRSRSLIPSQVLGQRSLWSKTDSLVCTHGAVRKAPKE